MAMVRNEQIWRMGKLVLLQNRDKAEENFVMGIQKKKK